jgi:hypothetical protein
MFGLGGDPATAWAHPGCCEADIRPPFLLKARIEGLASVNF